jgi:hypothetical protein
MIFTSGRLEQWFLPGVTGWVRPRYCSRNRLEGETESLHSEFDRQTMTAQPAILQ